MRIGIDVLDDHLSAVLLAPDSRVLASDSRPVGHDSFGQEALPTVLAATVADLVAGHPEPVTALMLGTDAFSRALRDGADLAPTAAIRFGLPATAALPPLSGWPSNPHHAFLCHGGSEYDGRGSAGFDETEFVQVVNRAIDAGVEAIALSSVFAPANPGFELRAAEIIRANAPQVRISLSHEIGRVGLLARENATILNASLQPLAERLTGAISQALVAAGVRAPLFLTNHDGTVAAVEHARDFPINTIRCAATNAMRGCGHLMAGVDCVVVRAHAEGVTVGVLHDGFPREAAGEVEVAGVATNFRAPDLIELGASELGASELGPDPTGLLRAIDGVRVFGEPLPVVAVGDRSWEVPIQLAHLHRPPQAELAGPIGAAIGPVSGHVERVVALDSLDHGPVLESARQEAIERAVAAGARPASVHVVQETQSALGYLPGNTTRVRVRALGEPAT